MARNQNSLCDRMEEKTLGETRLSRGASSPLARILLFIYYNNTISQKNTKEDILKNVGNQTVAGPH